MAYFDPDRLPTSEINRVARWLEANGCRDWVALEPVVLRGNVAEYTAICRKDRLSTRRFKIDRRTGLPSTQRKRRIRIRIPLSAIV